MATIAEVLQKPKGDNVIGLLVRVVSAGPQNEKPSTFREGETYTLQPATVADDTGQCSLSLTDGPLLRKGMWLSISAKENSKGKLSGATVGEYQNKKEIRATGFGAEVVDGPAPPPAHPTQAALEGQAPPAAQPPRQSAGNVWGGSSGKRAPFDPMGRQMAVDTLLGLMKEFVAEMAGLDFSGSTPNLLSEAPPHVLEAAQHMAVSILIGMQKGDIQ